MNQPIPILALADRPIVDIAREVARQGYVLVYQRDPSSALDLFLKQREERKRDQ